MVEVNLAELPLEILEKIVAELDPDEISSSVTKISRRFSEVSYNVLCNRFRELQGPILERLSESKANLERLSSVPTNFEDEMLQVSNFTFYQILYSEYKILCTIYFNKRSVQHSALVFHGVRSLKEFNKLLYRNSSNFQDDNVSSLLDSLRCCNSELLQFFFCKVWNVEKDYMGTLMLKLLNCSVCAAFDLEVSHEQFPKSKNSKCHISGNRNN
uniref:Putative transcriptional regulatory protein HPAG1_0159 n=1 Tax=Lygus hesperus TaxID=30085 RepID=A0A0A9YL62_LYGHE